MIEFEWRAVQASGDIATGRLEAVNASSAFRLLRERGLTPLQIDEVQVAGMQSHSRTSRFSALFSRSAGAGTGGVAAADIFAITSELAIMLRSGLTLANALRVLIEMSTKPPVQILLQGLLDDVKSGATLSRAIDSRVELFGDFYVNMVRAGEASGQLSEVMQRLVVHLERLRTLRESVVSASIYPAILLFVAILSLLAMMGFVVPQFEALFKGSGDALPLPTRIVMELGRAFSNYGILGAVLVAAGAWSLARWLQTGRGRAWSQGMIIRLPLVGDLVKKYELTLYSRSLGTLLGNGVPMLTALAIATRTVGNGALNAALSSVAPNVKEGTKIVDAMAATLVFSPLGLSLMRVGEETGRVGPMMLEFADILNREVETGIKRGLTILEPVLILVLGVLIAAIIVSILLGILSINDLAV